LAATRRNIAWQDSESLARLCDQITIDVNEDRVLLDGEDVTKEIRKMYVTSVIHHVADHSAIRGKLVGMQRRLAQGGNYVTEGRDQGTVAFPDAACKIFLTASPNERAERRMRDMHGRGELLSFEEVLRLQNERDERDLHRPVGRLVPAKDAVTVSTDGLSLEQVVAHLLRIVKNKV
jgi:cytidylate kinase